MTTFLLQETGDERGKTWRRNLQAIQEERSMSCSCTITALYPSQPVPSKFCIGLCLCVVRFHGWGRRHSHRVNDMRHQTGSRGNPARWENSGQEGGDTDKHTRRQQRCLRGNVFCFCFHFRISQGLVQVVNLCWNLWCFWTCYIFLFIYLSEHRDVIVHVLLRLIVVCYGFKYHFRLHSVVNV